MTVFPFADEGFLARVDALMRLQVTRFEVIFVAVFVVALVDAETLLRLRGFCAARWFREICQLRETGICGEDDEAVGWREGCGWREN